MIWPRNSRFWIVSRINLRQRGALNELRRLRASPRQCGRDLFSLLPGTYSSARIARLGDMPGYFQPRLTRSEYSGKSRPLILPDAPLRQLGCDGQGSENGPDCGTGHHKLE